MRRTLLAACLVAMSVNAAEHADGPQYAWIGAPIEVSATGEASIGLVDGVRKDASASVAAALERRRYLPAERDGRAVSALSWLSAKLVLAPSGEGFAVTVEDVRLGPRIQRILPPRFPSAMVRKRKSGYVELRLAISEEGAIARIETIAASDPAFDAAAREAIRKARFEAIRMEGKPVATDVSALVLFRYEEEPVPAYEAVCTVDPTQPRAEGQDGCMPTIEVTAQRIGLDASPPRIDPRLANN